MSQAMLGVNFYSRKLKYGWHQKHSQIPETHKTAVLNSENFSDTLKPGCICW